MSTQPGRIIVFLYGLVPLAVAASVLFVLFVLGGKAVQGYELRQEARAVERRIDHLRRENRRLARELEYYRSDEYVEKVAREELGLTRPGDVAVVIVPSGERRLPLLSTPTPVPSTRAAALDATTWQRWLSLFTGQD